MKHTYTKPDCQIVTILPHSALLLPISGEGSTNEVLIKESSTDIWSDEDFWDSSFEAE